MDALQLVIAGLPVAVGVFLVVQGLKVFNLVDTESAPKAALITAFVFAALKAASMIWPVAASYVDMFFVVFVGALTSGLFYEYIAAPILENFKGNVSVNDLD